MKSGVNALLKYIDTSAPSKLVGARDSSSKAHRPPKWGFARSTHDAERTGYEPSEVAQPNDARLEPATTSTGELTVPPEPFARGRLLMLSLLIGQAVGRSRAKNRVLPVATLLLLTALATAAASSSLDLAPFASSSGGCSQSFDGEWMRATFPAFPSPHPNLLIRLTSSVPVDQVAVGSADSIAYEPLEAVTGGADTTWFLGPSLAAGESLRVLASCWQGGGSITASLYDTPSVPVTFPGALTSGRQTEAVAELPFKLDRGGHVVAALMLRQGAVRLSDPAHLTGSGREFSSSGKFDLGLLATGMHQINLTALDGPQTQWQVEITRLPASVRRATALPSATRQGRQVTIVYTVDGDTRMTAIVRSRGGRPVRSLGSDFPVSAGRHSIRWEGLSESGRPVPDGVYRVQLRTDESTGREVSVTEDAAPPEIQLLSPRRLPSSRAVVVSVEDRTSGVAQATLQVDGRVVRRLTAGAAKLIYRPVSGWRSGKHHIAVRATDTAANAATANWVLAVG
jgi:hypothetical protein